MSASLRVKGGIPLVGDIEVRGAKNLVSKAMVAALLAEEPCRLRGVPEISDVQVVSGLLELHGVTIDSTDRDGELLMDPRNILQAHVSDIDAHAGSSRVPVLLCGPLLHRLGEAFIPDLGGCRIGEAVGRQARDVVDEHRRHLLPAEVGHRYRLELTREADEAVERHVTRPVDPGRADDGPAHAAAAHRLLGQPLGAEPVTLGVRRGAGTR